MRTNKVTSIINNTTDILTSPSSFSCHSMSRQCRLFYIVLRRKIERKRTRSSGRCGAELASYVLVFE